MLTVKQCALSDRLPTLPEVAMRLLEVAQQDCPDFKEVSQVVRADPIISGKILKTVNSALFAFTPKIESIENAIPKLGVTLLRTLVLSFHLARHKTHQEELEPVLQRHWRSSLTQAVFAELIAEELGASKADPPTCFLAGMLQDVGILAMISEAPKDYLEYVLKQSEFPGVTPSEREHFGFSHTDVSVEIVRNWGMEESFGEAIRRHHDQFIAPQDSTVAKSDRLKVILQAANLGATVLASSRTSSLSLNSSLDQWIDFLNVHFGFSEAEAEELISEVNQRVTQYSAVFNFNIGESVQTEDVVTEAKVMLQEIALKNQMNLIANASKPQVVRAGKASDQDELYRDALSGLHNRRFMNKHLNVQLAWCIKKRKPLALMFLDVDKFKPINDTYGHAAGDKAIKHVADWLNQSLRKNDIAIRLGGDEFIVLLQSVTKKDFEKVAKRIANKIPAMKLNDKEISVGMSIGCIFYQPQRGDIADINWLIEQADQAMYRAKKNGGGSVSIQRFDGTEAVCI